MTWVDGGQAGLLRPRLFRVVWTKRNFAGSSFSVAQTRPASVALSAPRTAEVMSLFRAKGGRQTKMRVPSDAEGLALAVGAAMQWARLRDASNRMFFTNVATEVKRLKCTPSDWSHDEMRNFVHERVFNSIPQKGLEKYLQRSFAGLDRAGRAQHFKEFVESVMYKFLATVEAGVDYDAAHELAIEAKLERVLQCTALGGKSEWTLDEWLSPEVWEECGEQAGLKLVARKFMTIVAAGGQADKPIDPICGECGELKCLHKGDRLNLTLVACKCDEVQQPKAEDMRQRPAAEEKAPKRSRGFGDDLDADAEGVLQTYQRKLDQIAKRYPELQPLAVVKKLLGKDVDIDEPIEKTRASNVPPVTGEQGGRMLACYLYYLELNDDGFLDSSDDAMDWLQTTQPKFLLYPAQKLCIDKAIIFLPKLKAGLAKNHKSKQAASSNDDPDLDDILGA